MKMVCHREGLLAACQVASAAVATRDVKPVLRNLKAIVDTDRCTLMATDLELGIRLDVRGISVEEPGEALLPTQRFLAILREATEDELTIDASPDRTIVRGQTTEFEMPAEDPSAFPDIPGFEEDSYHEVTAGVLREMITRVKFAAAEHAHYGATMGILFELESEQIRLVATDGRRLAVVEGAVQSQGDPAPRGHMPVVPKKAVILLERNLVEPDELVRISMKPNEVLVKTERAVLYSRLVEGRFPNYKQVLPQKNQIKVPIIAGPFLTAVRQAAIMTDDESRRVSFHFGDNRVTLQARGMEAGRSRVDMPLEYGGKDVEISFNPKFLVDMLNVLDASDEMTLELADGQSPALFHIDSNYQYVIVPLVASGE